MKGEISAFSFCGESAEDSRKHVGKSSDGAEIGREFVDKVVFVS
jgi:hypothetical protein